jgi:hypothetical protein
MTKIKEQKLPKWFKGELYKEGDVVRNRFSGEEYELNAMELSMYDLVMGCCIMTESGLTDTKVISDLRRGLDWFRTHNAKAYMVLLD